MDDNQTEARQLANLEWELEHDCRLPNATGFGLEIFPGTPCRPLDDQERKDWVKKAAALEGSVDPGELKAAKAHLAGGLAARNYAAGGGFDYADPVQNEMAIAHLTDGTYNSGSAIEERAKAKALFDADVADWTGPTIDTLVPE